jgi:hypothetical protein
VTTALEGGEESVSRPGRSLPPGKTRDPLYRTLGGPQGRSGQVRKISFPPEFDPRTVQSVASRYTDYATRPFDKLSHPKKKKNSTGSRLKDEEFASFKHVRRGPNTLQTLRNFKCHSEMLKISEFFAIPPHVV